MDRDGDLGGAIREASPVDGWACRARREPRRLRRVSMTANVWTGAWPQRGLDLTLALGSTSEAAKVISSEMGRSVSGNSVKGMLRDRFPGWQRKLDKALPDPTSPEAVLRDRVKDLEAEVERLQGRVLTDERVKREILRVAAAPTNAPRWLAEPNRKAPSSPGVPCLMISDEHWGEVVEPSQVGGVNSYDLEIARARLRALGENTLDVLFRHTVSPKYPGIVLAFGGDGTTGDIHEELTATNEDEIMPCVLDLRDHRVALIDRFLAEFESVFVAGVTGNHGRLTLKLRAKGRAHTSFDWLGYQMLARHYAGNKRIQFQIPDGPDALFSIYGHRYLLTHGDQFRGGDGMIGALGPIIRGDHKKRSRNGQVGQNYDTLLLGHWHQLIRLQRLIVNGSLKGYDEYASAGNFPFEPPQQACWCTHPERGPTDVRPIFVEKDKRSKPRSEWVAWAA